MNGGNAFGLLSAISWGSSDFVAGMMARRDNALRIVWFGNLVSCPLMLALGLMMHDNLPTPSATVLATIAGISAAFGSLVLYRGMARNKTAVIAPIGALVGATLPVIVDAILNDPPSSLQLLGIGAALVALWLLSGGRREALQRENVVAGVVAGIGWGMFYVLIPHGANDGAFLPNAVANLGATAVLGFFIYRQGMSFKVSRAVAPGAALAAILSSMGDLNFVLSAQMVGMDRAAILASFCSAVTVLLACTFLKERLTLAQWAGITATLIAIPLIVG